MPVQVVSAKAGSKLVAVPKLRPFVFQVVSFKNPLAYGLMKGALHLYRAGSYAGDTCIDYKALGVRFSEEAPFLDSPVEGG
jgi:hypothetical protein